MREGRSWISILLFMWLGLVGITPSEALAAFQIIQPATNPVLPQTSVPLQVNNVPANTLRVDYYRSGSTTRIATSNSSPFSTSWSAIAGSFTLTAKAINKITLVATQTNNSASIKVVNPPTVSLTDSTGTTGWSSNQGVDPGVIPQVFFNASATSNSGGSISKVQYFYALGRDQATTPISIGFSSIKPHFTVPWTPPSVPGTYTVVAVATDSAGTNITGKSNSVNLVVTNIHSALFYPDVPASTSTSSANNGSNPCRLRFRTYYDSTKMPKDATGTALGYHPMMVIHGGLWLGDREWTTASVEDPVVRDTDYDEALMYFTSQSFQINSASYRLLKSAITDDKDGEQLGCNLVTTDDQFNDVKQAFNLTSLFNWGGWGVPGDSNINQNERLLILGEDAGAHLALRLVNEFLQPYEFNKVAVISVSGILDFMDLWLQESSLFNYRMDSDGSAGRTSLQQTRQLSFSGYGIPTGEDCNGYCWVYPWGLDRYHENSLVINNGAQGGAFTSAQAVDPFILNGTFRLKTADVLDSQSNHLVSRPPVYMVTGNNDAFLPPEQSLAYCEAFGAPVPDQSSSSTWDPATKMTFFCGTGTQSKLDIVINGGHLSFAPPAPANYDRTALFNRISSWYLNTPAVRIIPN